MITTYMLIFAGALALVIGVTPLMRRLAPQIGLMDKPHPRKVHTTPMPLMGGVALYAAIVGVLLLFQDRYWVSQLVSILVGATWVSFLGMWDDRWGLKPALKLGGQVVGALILVVSGVHVDLVQSAWLNSLITIVWVVGITNAMNLLDNVDGLSGGIAAIAAAFFLLMASLNGQFLVASLSAALLGAAIGFLVYNFNPASIFMGDAGSLFIGFVLAAIGIKVRFPGHPALFTWFIPILILGIPIFDTTLVFISRWRRRRNPFTAPGQDHLSHRLIARGWTRREAVLLLYLAAAALGVFAMFCAQAGGWENYLVLGMAFIGALAALWKFEFDSNGIRNAG